MSRILVTSALPYANGYIHLGHLAGAYLPADIFCRQKRLMGEELLYVCGSDEHGVAITIAAEQEGVKPKQIIDKYHQANEAAFDKFGMSFDIYSRTSKLMHHETAKAFFKDFLKKGLLHEKKEEQFYDPKANMFLPDRYVEGICPNCGAEGARGDQCDSCGAYYNQLELKEPKSRVTGDTPIVKKTTHWYMRFDKFQSFLEEYIESHAGDWKDNVLQQTRSWLKQGLNERAITRDLNWGISIDDIDEVPKEHAEGKVLYVWFEAVLGYISATKELMTILENENKAKASDWKKWWQSEETDYIAFIGKDNIVFHTLIFPALLHAKGDNYILPKNVPANEFLNLESQKISKSRNWTIDLQDFINDFPEPHYIDALRYGLAMNFPETRDSDFTWKDFQSRNNNELSAILGNFVNRTLTFLHKNFDGKVPELTGKYSQLKDDWTALAENLAKGNEPNEQEFIEKYNENDLAVVRSLASGVSKISELYKRYRFRDGITQTMNIARSANKYFNDEEPWKSAKSDKEKCAKTLYVCMQLVRSLAVVFAPILPHTSWKIYEMLNEEPYLGEENHGFKASDYWHDAGLPLLKSGKQTNKPELLFTRIEDDVVKAQQAKLGNQGEKKPDENLITIDDFMNVKLRTATVLEAEKIKKSKKLLKLQVDLGDEKRQIVAGISLHYNPEELIGKTVVVVANLKPAKLMGLESQGMLLAANTKDGNLAIATFEDKEIGAGAEVR